MLGRVQLLVGTLVVAMMAGCAGSSDPGTNVIDGGEDGGGTAAIQGLVTNEEGLPVAGAQLAILALDRTVVTGEAGEFKLENLAAGTYQVFASKLGYGSVAKSVTLEEGQTVTLEIVLSIIEVDEVYHMVYGPYQGYVTCAYTRPGVSGVTGSISSNCNNLNVGGVLGDQENVLEIEPEQDNVWAVVGEMRWTPTAYATSDSFALFFTHEDGYGSDWWCMSTGDSPVQFVYHINETKRDCDREGSDPDGEPDSDHVLHLTAFLDFQTISTDDPTAAIPPNVAFQQRYESIGTIFYGQDPQLPFTAFPDA